MVIPETFWEWSDDEEDSNEPIKQGDEDNDHGDSDDEDKVEQDHVTAATPVSQDEDDNDTTHDTIVAA